MKLDKLFSTIFLLCLGLLVIQQIFFNPISWFNINTYYFWEKILEILSSIQYGLVIFAIVLGWLLFYKNKNNVNIIEIEMEKEEKRREDEFVIKFTRINKIPILRRIVKRIYKEWAIYALVLIIIILIGFILRVWNINTLAYTQDEWIYDILFKNMDKWNILPILNSWWLYIRGFLYTYISYVFYKISWDTLIAIRTVSLIFWTFLIALFYFVLKNLTKNKIISLLGSVIIAITPQLIIYSIIGRHYMMMFFLSLLFLHFLFLDKNKLKFTFFLIFLILATNYEFFFLLLPILLIRLFYDKNKKLIILSLLFWILFLLQPLYLSKIIWITKNNFWEAVRKPTISSNLLTKNNIEKSIKKLFFYWLTPLFFVFLLILFLNYQYLKQYFIANNKNTNLFFYAFGIYFLFFIFIFWRNQIRHYWLFLILSIIFVLIIINNLLKTNKHNSFLYYISIILFFSFIPYNTNYPVTFDYKHWNYTNIKKMIISIFDKPYQFWSISSSSFYSPYSDVIGLNLSGTIISSDFYNLTPYIKVDYILNEYMYESFTYSEQFLNIYNNIKFITLEELIKIEENKKIIYIIGDYRFTQHLSESTKNHIYWNYNLIYKSKSENIWHIDNLDDNSLKVFQFIPSIY